MGPPPAGKQGAAALDPMNLGTCPFFVFVLLSVDAPAWHTCLMLCCSLADSTAFDAKAYYEQLITTASLPALLKRENELLTGEPPKYRETDVSISDGSPVLVNPEIRELDSERQSLVYNHHHELIAASDTIAAVCARLRNVAQ